MKHILKQLTLNKILTASETYSIFEAIASDPSVTDEEIRQYLYSGKMREFSGEELLGGARFLRDHATPFPRPEGDIIDTCGTGGSGKDTFNTSTAVAFVLAAAGLKVVKHGNRASSSRSGSADLLAALGYNLEQTPEQSTAELEGTGFTFLFAPRYHQATSRVGPIRKSLGVKTIFNFLGPLANPARPDFQLMGVSDEKLLEPMAQTLLQLGVKRAYIVHGKDGLDEITLCDETVVFEIDQGKITSKLISPEQYGVGRCSFDAIKGLDTSATIHCMKEIFAGKSSAYADLVALNSAFALKLAGKVNHVLKGLELVRELFKTGVVLKRLDEILLK
jgi:anthranilate phosphoribosyltransferase